MIEYIDLPVIQQQPMSINELANKCGLFNEDTDLNNGYGCLESNKDEPNKCYAWDCPLAHTIDKEDCDKKRLNYSWLDDSDNVIQYRKVK